MNPITAKITSISKPLPSRNGDGTFRRIVFRDCKDTKQTYKTHINQGAINEYKWSEVMQVGLVLSGLEILPKYPGIINADSYFKVEEWRDINSNFKIGDIVCPIHCTNIKGIVQYIWETNQGAVAQVKWSNGNMSNKRSYEIVKI